MTSGTQHFKDEAQTVLFLRPSSYRTVNTFLLGCKNQPVYGVSGTSSCLFLDKYKTYKVWTEYTIVEC